MFNFKKNEGVKEEDKRMNAIEEKVDSLVNAMNEIADYLKERDGKENEDVKEEKKENEDMKEEKKENEDVKEEKKEEAKNKKNEDVKEEEKENEDATSTDAKLDVLIDIVEKLVSKVEQMAIAEEAEVKEEATEDVAEDVAENEGEAITDEEKDDLRKDVIEKSNSVKNKGFFNKLKAIKENANVHESAKVNVNTLGSRINRGNEKYGKIAK